MLYSRDSELVFFGVGLVILVKAVGMLLFEVGEGQSEAVSEMLLTGGFRTAATKRDTLGVERVVLGVM